MANYYAYARSNYFAVTDEVKFDEFCKKFSLEKTKNDKGQVGFLANGEDGMPSSVWSDKDQDYIDTDPLDELAPLLKPGEVAICMQIGWEKMRYLTGWATAINWKRQTKRVDLSDIYDLSKKLTELKNITLCEY